MNSDKQLEKMIKERNEFERENIRLKKDLGEMCQAMCDQFNGAWDEEHQRIADDETRRLIDKNKRYIKG